MKCHSILFPRAVYSRIFFDCIISKLTICVLYTDPLLQNHTIQSHIAGMGLVNQPTLARLGPATDFGKT